MALMWVTLYVTLGLHTMGLLMRWLESYWAISFFPFSLNRVGFDHVPLSNFYESLIFYAWCVSLILILMKKRLSYPIITLVASLISLFFMGYASLSPSVHRNIEPLIPALQSNWLHIHVITCFLAYAAFAVSFIAGLLYLVEWKGVIPPRETLDEINYRSIIVGFPMLSAGILTGAVWAHYAWGRIGAGTRRRRGH